MELQLGEKRGTFKWPMMARQSLLVALPPLKVSPALAMQSGSKDIELGVRPT